MHMPVDETPENPSLWREIADGKAKPLTLVLVNVILLIALTGVVLLASFFVAAMTIPTPYRSSGRSYVHVPDEVAGWMTVLGALAFVGSTAWIWTRGKRKFQRVFYGVAQTLGVIVLTLAIGFAALLSFGGDEGYVVFGVLCMGIAALIYVWMQVWRRSNQGRPWHNLADGKLDLRCPTCGYRMIGLSEARCPECGATYTVDELLAQQEFAPRSVPASPPPIPETN